MIESKTASTTESATRNHDWERFFPESYRRKLAQQLAEKIAMLNYVREIVAVSYAPTTPESNFFIVVVNDSILDNDHALGDCADKVYEEWENVLSNGNQGVLINPPIVRTESDFEGFISESSFKWCKFGTLWQAGD